MRSIPRVVSIGRTSERLLQETLSHLGSPRPQETNHAALRPRPDPLDPRRLDAPRARSLLPGSLAARAQVYRWLLFAATELEQPLWRITRNTSLYAEPQRQPSDVAIASNEFREMAAVLDGHLQGRSFVAGDAFSVADIVTAYTLDWANEVELLDRFPRLRAYMERMYERPQAPLRIAEAFARLSTGEPV